MNLNIDNRKKEISSEVFDEIISDISEFEKLNTNIGKSAIYGNNQGTFEFTDGNRHLDVGYIPQNRGEVVDMSEAKLIECDIIVIQSETDSAWLITAENSSELTHFPELRQSFYEDISFQNRDADYKYHFPDGDELISVHAPNPVGRLEEPITIVAVESLGGKFPQIWLLETDDGDFHYLRERSGSIQLFDGMDIEDDTIFQAYIGREHPGTHLEPHEVLNIVSSVDYIKFKDDMRDKVPEEAHDEYWSDVMEEIQYDKILDEDSKDLLFK